MGRLGWALFLGVGTPIISAAADPDYLPFNHVGPGYIACRSFISVPGKGDIPFWSDVFPSSLRADAVKPPFEAFIKEQFSSRGRIYSGTCFKFASVEQARKIKEDSMYVAVAVQTRWTYSGSGAPTEADATAGQAPSEGTPSREARRIADAGEDAERRRVEELNGRIKGQLDSAEAENRARQGQFADATAAHQRAVEAAERARMQHEAEVERSRQAAEAHRRGLEEYERTLAAGNFDEQQKQAMLRAAKEKAKAARENEARLAEQKRRIEERNRPVEFKEGVVLCEQPRNGSKQWRCRGPLQTTYAVLDTPGANVSLGQACGSDRSIRDLGMTAGYRAYGCGFGIHPTARDDPGNIDVSAQLGVYVPSRATFRCPPSKLAYCRGN